MRTIETNEKASVYLCVEVPFTNKVKIGRTGQTLKRRLQAIQVGNPNKVEMGFMSYPIPYHKQYEKNLKIAYKDKHLQGEWYKMESWEVDALTDNLKEDEELLNDNIENEEVKLLLEGVKNYGEDE
tara:strand:- start:115 stop:492 length:378 start_codon:yes stop_codon:yes gene_type:complete